MSFGEKLPFQTTRDLKMAVFVVKVNFWPICNPQIQCPLGFATLDKAAALALATSRAVTDLRQYINSDLGYSDLKICFLL